MIPTRAIKIARDFIAEHEGLRLKPYLDSAGLETIGYGHLVRKYERFDEITKDEAEAIRTFLEAIKEKQLAKLEADLRAMPAWAYSQWLKGASFIFLPGFLLSHGVR